MEQLLSDVCCASIPIGALPLLAALRTASNVRAGEIAGCVWLHWPAGEEEVLRRVLPIRGAELFARRDGHWYRPGQHLPVFNVPDVPTRTLLHLLTPAPLQADEPPLRTFASVTFRLVRDEQPRATTALECGAAELLRWADVATTHALASVAIATRRERVLLLGKKLPSFAGAVRFWGRSIFLPLGYRAEPSLPESALRDALTLSPEEMVFIREGRAEVVNREAIAPATRAGIRRAWGVHTP